MFWVLLYVLLLSSVCLFVVLVFFVWLAGLILVENFGWKG